MSSESRDFCPNCGDPVEVDPSDREPLPEGGATPTRLQERQRSLCDDCYFEQFDLVDAPDRVEIRVCARCGAVYQGNRWVDVGAEDYVDIAIDAVSDALTVHVEAEDIAWDVAPEPLDKNSYRMHCHFSGVVRGALVEETVEVPVRISRQTCTRCGRIAGSYYASIVQVRAKDRTPTEEEADRAKEIAHEIVDEMEATGDRNAFVTETKDTPDGPNIKVSTNKIGKNIARKLVEEFGGSFSDSETLVTEDSDGQEVYRVTFAVRLPPFLPGDIILPEGDDDPVLVRSAHGNLKGVRLGSGEPYEASYEDGDSPDAEKLGTVEDAEEATVVTVEDEHAIQILDPETYQATTVARLDSVDADADTVRVFKSHSGLYLLPDE